jgi:hypothetical protein
MYVVFHSKIVIQMKILKILCWKLFNPLLQIILFLEKNTKYIYVDTKSGKRVNLKRTVVTTVFTKSVPGINFHREHEVS